MLNLKVSIDQNSGFCFGVVYAIQLAEAYLEENGYLYCLGDIVHNDEEVSRLKKKGLITIDHENLKDLSGETVLIRAHGEPPETYKTALENNINLIDASCPVVLKLQNRVKETFDKNKQPILIYGKHGHAEVKGLLGQTDRKAIIFQSLEELDKLDLPESVSLFSQTTKDTNNLYQVKSRLESKGINVDFNDTICRQVSNRDPQLQEFSSRYDVIIFVAGTKSSNGKVLFQVCKKSNPETHFISTPEELKNEWFSTGQTVGICGATSTPMWLMEKVKEEIESL